MIKNIIGAKKETLALLLITNITNIVVNIEKPHRPVYNIRKIFCYYFYRQQQLKQKISSVGLSCDIYLQSL